MGSNFYPTGIFGVTHLNLHDDKGKENRSHSCDHPIKIDVFHFLTNEI